MRKGLELGGRYRLEAPLGKGGMGEVWRGIDLRMRRPVAVKILPLSGTADGGAVARFRREAENAAMLNHRGITTVHDIGEHTDGGLRLLFLVMELMNGRDLASVLKENPGGLPIPQVTDWAVQILDALAVAHRQGVVHRDIKPANLFLTDDGPVKVCDFGISRLADATKITVTGSAVGTPLYMAPEQIEGRALDARTDLYAFGCVLYQLLTGTTWVDADSGFGAVFYQHLNQTPMSPQSVRPEIDDGLSTLVLDLLAKRPDDRPKDASAAAERLRGLGAHATRGGGPQPVPPEPHDGGTSPSRPRTATAAVALALLCLPGLLAIVFEAAEALPDPYAPKGIIWMNLVVCGLEMVMLVMGARLLFQGAVAGRRMIAITGGVVALHSMSFSAQAVLVDANLTAPDAPILLLFVFSPLTAVAAAAATIMTVLPSTSQWCLRRS